MKKFIIALFILLFSTFAFAVDFHITIIDSEIDIPLEGVTLTLSNKAGGPWETDENGEVVVQVEDVSKAVILQAYLPGYAVKKVRLSEDETEVTIFMSIEDVMEGKELVVEKDAYQTADAESGISVALTKEQIQTTALIGSFPDVMTTVKTLPGVGYAGAYCQQPSIRGSYPYETACVLDGMYVLQPYHWSGEVSIFDPLMVDSVKLSHGIFSAQYGHATAALLDVNSVNPIGDFIKVNMSVSDIQTDLFAQIPLTKKAGIMGGLRMTYMNTIPWLYDGLGLTSLMTKGEIKRISDYLRMPYLYDYYLKAFYTPVDSLSINLNGFLGLEGLGAHLNIETEENEKNTPPENEKNRYLSYFYDGMTDVNADWKNIFGFGSLDIKWLPVESFQLHGSGSYNIYKNNISIGFHNDYESKYSEMCFDWSKNEDDVLNQYEHNVQELEIERPYYIELFQGKLAGSYQINPSHLISVGAEELYQSKTSKERYFIDFSTLEADWWSYEGEPNFEDLKVPVISFNQKMTNDGNDIINTSAYSFWEFGNDTSLVKGELGLRFEHYILKRSFDSSKVYTSPYFNPRFSIQCTPIRNSNNVDKLTISAGTGVFTKMVDQTMDLENEVVLNKDNFKPDRNIFALAGGEIDFNENMSFQIEGYYKYYTNRFYTVATPDLSAEENFMGTYPTTKTAFSDGIGHVAGFDCMLHKKSGRFFDGYLCYSYVFSRYKNPTGYIKDVVENTVEEDPLGMWYYPYFHRYHTFNAVLNYRPTAHITWTLSGGFASGSPKVDIEDILNGTKKYNDKARNPPVFPVNLRFAYSNYAAASKVKWEFFAGIENLLGFLNKTSLLGAIVYEKELDLSNIANFDIGLPTLSVGFRLSY